MPREYSPHVAVEILEKIQSYAALIQEAFDELNLLRNNPQFGTPYVCLNASRDARRIVSGTKDILKEAKALREATRQAKIKRRILIRKEKEGD